MLGDGSQPEHIADVYWAVIMLPEFQNAALLDFSRPENEKGMQCGLETIRGQLGKTHPLVIDGRRLEWLG